MDVLNRTLKDKIIQRIVVIIPQLNLNAKQNSGTQYNAQVDLSAFLGLLCKIPSISRQRRFSRWEKPKTWEMLQKTASIPKKRMFYQNVREWHFDMMRWFSLECTGCSLLRLNASFNVMFYLTHFHVLFTFSLKKFFLFLLIYWLCACARVCLFFFINQIQVLWYLCDHGFFGRGWIIAGQTVFVAHK